MESGINVRSLNHTNQDELRLTSQDNWIGAEVIDMSNISLEREEL